MRSQIPLWRRYLEPLREYVAGMEKDLVRLKIEWGSGGIWDVDTSPDSCPANKRRTDKQIKQCHRSASDGRTDVRARWMRVWVCM